MNDPALAQRAYTTILEHFVEHGRGPHYTELAVLLGISTEEARLAQADAVEGSRIGCWNSPLTDYIGSWAPFSNLPTQYLVSVDSVQKWYGQWGLESLAVRWLFPGREVRIDARDLATAEPILLRFRDEEILEISPDTVVGHINIPMPKWGEAEKPFNWERMNLFRSEETVPGWSQTAPGSEKKGTLPVRTWAAMFSADLFRRRLDPDYLSKVSEYLGSMIALMEELGMVGPFFFTQR